MLIDEKRSVVLLQGVAKDSFFGLLKKCKAKNIVVLEGRPRLDGAKILCRKLLKNKITPILISDNMAGFLFYKDLVREIWIAYQSIDKAGATCNIGALILGVLGKQHKVPVYLYPSMRKSKPMAAPNEISKFNGKLIAPKGIKGYVPLIEKLPKKYITRVFNE